MSKRTQKDDFTICLSMSEQMNKYNESMLNVLGYLEYLTPQFTQQITNHEGWFFAQQSRIINETGVNERTLRRYLNRFVADGIIEYHAGKRTKDGAFASEFKLNWEYKLLDMYNGFTSSNTLSEAPQLIGDNFKNSIGDNIGDNLNNELNYKYLQTETIEDKNNSVPPEYRIQNTESRKQSYSIYNSKDETTTRTNELLTFCISFLGAETREQGIELYRNLTNTLQDDETKTLIADYTKKVANLKGWNKPEINNPSSIEDTMKNNSTSNERKQYNVDWSLNLQAAKDYFKQTAKRYAKQWATLDEETRKERFIMAVSGGFPETTFQPFEPHIKGITMEKANEFAKLVHDEAEKQAKKTNTLQNESTTNNLSSFEYNTTDTANTPTASIDNELETFSDIIDNYANEQGNAQEMTLEQQIERSENIMSGLLGWSETPKFVLTTDNRIKQPNFEEVF